MFNYIASYVCIIHTSLICSYTNNSMVVCVLFNGILAELCHIQQVFSYIEVVCWGDGKPQ